MKYDKEEKAIVDAYGSAYVPSVPARERAAECFSCNTTFVVVRLISRCGVSGDGEGSAQKVM